MKPFAAVKAGAAAIAKPAVVKTIAIVRKPKTRLPNDRRGGTGEGAVSGRGK